MDRKKIKKLFDKLINADTIKLMLLFFPLLYFLISDIRSGEFNLRDFLDTGILVSFLVVFICNSIAYFLEKVIGRYCEDAVKLSTDYDKLSGRYSREKLITYRGKKFPVIALAHRTVSQPHFQIEIDHSRCREKYKLPKQIEDNADHLFESHKNSIIYNNMNVRLDDLQTVGSRVILTYSGTTYYDSLITNRAMDYSWPNGKTIRDVYEPGPFLSSLQDSKLSNHLGFNGFVELSDGKIIFVMRKGDMSIGKDTLGNSIGASMKVKYALDDNRQLTLDTLGNAIRREIADELKIDVPESVDLTKSIFAFYRDIVEGGKPQFLFYHKVDDLDSKAFPKQFLSRLNENKKKDLRKAVVDGTHFVFFTKEELAECMITAGELQVTEKKKYRIMPSASAATVMLLRYLELAE